MLVKDSIGSYAILGECLALFMLTVVFVGCRAELHCGCGLSCCAHGTAVARGDSTGAVLVLVVTCPLLSDRAWGPDVQKTVVSTVVDVAVFIQRHGGVSRTAEVPQILRAV